MLKYFFLFSIVLAGLLTATGHALAQRALGLDISAWQGNISQTTWNNIRSLENREFVFIRSSRGGTTGYYNQSNAGNDNPVGQNTLSQRYDDPYFVQNINRSTTAGMFAGSYHFSRPDIVEGTLNSNGIPNNGTDEAAHFIQMAGAFMRPGYMLPVHDLEAGSGIRTPSELAQFAIDFSQKIYDDMGIRPAIYSGNNYTSLMESIPESTALVGSYPTLWVARWPNQADPNSIPVQTANPGDYTPTVYGPWDNPPNSAHPWHFWQYASTGRLQSYNSGNSNLDFDVANGGAEYLKDHLVPAVWMNDNSGDWSALANWNSGKTPVAPVTGPGQVAPVGTQTLPTPRLPGAAGSGVTSGQHDTVVLDRPNANITVTLSSGDHNVRKLFTREALNISGGSLSVNYVPVADSTPISAQFSAPVSLSGGNFSAHTLQVDAGQTFTVNSGSLTVDTLNLAGNLSISNPAVDTITNLRLAAGATLNLDYSSLLPNTVNALYIGGVQKEIGIWGAEGSGAQFTSPQITGTGRIQVQSYVPPPSGVGNVLDDFEVDEGHFHWNYNQSPPSQVFGLAGTTTIDRVTTEHQGSGVASQLLNLVSDGSANWQLRHNSGTTTSAAPASNVPLESTGYIGFWLKTDDPGVKVQIALDDPGTADRGILQDVIADNQWHLYQWNLEDDAQWDGWVTGDGMITGTTVTIDSIFFYGSTSAQIYLDTVSHNPLGLLAAAPIPGDYNGDGFVTTADYQTWQASFGLNVTPGTGADGNGNGTVDAADYVFWYAHLTSGSGASLQAVPEPAAILLLLVGIFGLLARRTLRRAF